MDFNKLVGANPVKDRLQKWLTTIVDLDNEAETIKAQRKEALASAEEEDHFVAAALSAIARLQRTGTCNSSAEVWPIVEKYAEILGIVLPSKAQLDLFDKTED